MDPLPAVTRDEALREIADAPATLEFRAVALDPQAAYYRSGGGLILVDLPGRLIGAVGPVLSRDVDAIFQNRQLDCELLADRAAYQILREGHVLERAIIQTLSDPWRSPQRQIADLVIRPLALSDSLDHLTGELRDEIDRERRDEIVFAGFFDGAAVSFSYSASSTETWADISIDTLEEHRGRGIGAAVVSTLIDEIIRQGKSPVWGAVEDNRASLRLAKKLGFTLQAGELFVQEPQPSAAR
jgi:GNAT superfamily N-acetyltransferase